MTAYTIYNEDCIETMNVMKEGSIDLVVTSPPYDSLRDYEGYSFDFENVAKGLWRVIKPGGVVVWIVGDSTKKGNESGTSFRQVLRFKSLGFNLFDTMIYQKKMQSQPGNLNMYWQVFEYMFILSKGLPKTTNLIKDKPNKYPEDGSGTHTYRNKAGELVTKKRGVVREFGKRLNIWQYNTGLNHSTKDKIAFKHPAIFPEKLAEDHIKSWSNRGDLVYDPFMGSGTVAKMCEINGRHWIGSEISALYCDIAKQRLTQERL